MQRHTLYPHPQTMKLLIQLSQPVVAHVGKPSPRQLLDPCRKLAQTGGAQAQIPQVHQRAYIGCHTQWIVPKVKLLQVGQCPQTQIFRVTHDDLVVAQTQPPQCTELLNACREGRKLFVTQIK
ncbi:hypothetical protein D9M73_140750 [compost metagenome]